MSIVSLLPWGCYHHYPCPPHPCRPRPPRFLLCPCCCRLHCPCCCRPLMPPVCCKCPSIGSMPLVHRCRSRCSLSSASVAATATCGSLHHYGWLLRCCIGTSTLLSMSQPPSLLPLLRDCYCPSTLGSNPVRIRKRHKKSIFIYGTTDWKKQIWTKFLASLDLQWSLTKLKKELRQSKGLSICHHFEFN